MLQWPTTLLGMTGAALPDGPGIASLAEACLYVPVGVLVSVLVIDVFFWRRREVDLDQAVGVLLFAGSVLFIVGGLLTFSQASSLGQQVALRAAGAGVLLGILCAIAAMLKQQCYLRKLLALAREQMQGSRPRTPVLFWPICYFSVLLTMLVGAAGVAWLRPDLEALAASTAALESWDDAEGRIEVDEGRSVSVVTSLALKEVDPMSGPTPVPGGPKFPDGGDRFVGYDDEMMEEESRPMADPPPGMAMARDLEVGPPSHGEAPHHPAKPGVSSAVHLVVGTSREIDGRALQTFRKSVAPLLRDRCFSCHGPDEQKGGLRLDAPAWIRKGGNSGPVVVAFQPEVSPLYTATILPEGDSDLMPAKGKRLTREQTGAIRGWIQGGAPMGDGKDLAAAVTSPPAALAGNPTPGDIAEALAAAHIRFKPVGQGLFDVDCSLTRNFPEVGLDLGILRPIAGKIHTLNLSKATVQDADLALLAQMSDLKRLSLSRTAIGDDALRHLSGLSKLEILNLYGTNVGDAGLEHIKELSKLKEIYLWNSKATAEGANRLKQMIPGLKVNIGQ